VLNYDPPVRVVLDRHPLPTSPTDHQALEQGRPLARRTAPAPQVRLAVLLQVAEVLLVFLPREVALVSITDECDPLFARAQLGVLLAVDPLRVRRRP